MLTAAPHVHGLTTERISRVQLVGWWWPLAVAMVLGLVIVAAGVVLVARRRKNLSRPGRIAVTVVAVWAFVGATAVFLSDVRHGSDWVGSAVSGAFIVLYGLIGCSIVWAVDKTVRKVRRLPRLAP